MGQRINIQYSIDIDDLEKEVNRLLSLANATLKTLPHDCISEKETLSFDIVKDIDSLRQKLATVDFTLRDVSNIVSAYVAYEAQLSMDNTVEQNIEPAEARNEIPS